MTQSKMISYLPWYDSCNSLGSSVKNLRLTQSVKRYTCVLIPLSTFEDITHYNDWNFVSRRQQHAWRLKAMLVGATSPSLEATRGLEGLARPGASGSSQVFKRSLVHVSRGVRGWLVVSLSKDLSKEAQEAATDHAGSNSAYDPLVIAISPSLNFERNSLITSETEFFK